MVGRKKKWKRRSAGNIDPQRDPFVLFLDETLYNCQPIHEALKSMGINFVPHGERFAPGTVDTDWLPIAGEERWAVLTADKRIRFNELEIAQVTGHGVRQFVFSSGQLNGAMMGSILKIAMPRMLEIFYEQEPPFIACIFKSGKVEVRYDKNGSVHQRQQNEKN
jgi:PIN like domain